MQLSMNQNFIQGVQGDCYFSFRPHPKYMRYYQLT